MNNRQQQWNMDEPCWGTVGSRSCQAEAELTTPMRVSTYNEGLMPHGDAAVAQIAQWQASLSGRWRGARVWKVSTVSQTRAKNLLTQTEQQHKHEQQQHEH